MVVYDHTANKMRNISLQNVYGLNEGFFHGKAEHIPIGPDNGYLLSIFGEKYPLQKYFSNTLTGQNVIL